MIIAVIVGCVVAGLVAGIVVGLCKQDDERFESPLISLILGLAVAFIYTILRHNTAADISDPVTSYELVRPWPNPERDFLILGIGVAIMALTSTVTHWFVNR